MLKFAIGAIGIYPTFILVKIITLSVPDLIRESDGVIRFALDAWMTILSGAIALMFFAGSLALLAEPIHYLFTSRRWRLGRLLASVPLVIGGFLTIALLALGIAEAALAIADVFASRPLWQSVLGGVMILVFIFHAGVYINEKRQRD